MIQPLGEDALAWRINGACTEITNLIDRRTMWQSHMQRQAWHAGQGVCITVQYRTYSVKTMSRVQHDHLLTQERNGGAILPFDPG